MKPLGQIEAMLLSELNIVWDNIGDIDSNVKYHNEVLGDTSFLLAAILENHLKKKEDWDSTKWIDDSLITKTKIIDNKLLIWGIMIWGKNNVTEQWTDPFYFEIELTKGINYGSYCFLFADLEMPEVSYEDFKQNELYWDKQFYLDENWSPSERNWCYIISSRLVPN